MKREKLKFSKQKKKKKLLILLRTKKKKCESGHHQIVLLFDNEVQGTGNYNGKEWNVARKCTLWRAQINHRCRQRIQWGTSKRQKNSAVWSLRKKFPYSELFWSKCGKIRTSITPNMDTFYTVDVKKLVARAGKVVKRNRWISEECLKHQMKICF